MIDRLLRVLCLAMLGAVPALLAMERPATAQERSILSPAQVEKLAVFLVKRGHDTWLDSSVTSALGLTPQGETLTVRQLTIAAGKEGLASCRPVAVRTYHRAPDGGWLLMTTSDVSSRAFRTNSRQELVAAVDKRTDQPPVVIPTSDAQNELKAELSCWADVADKF